MTILKKAKDLKEGDKVDLASCPFLKDHPSADFEYAEVVLVEMETPNCVLVGYDGVDHVGYDPEQLLVVEE